MEFQPPYINSHENVYTIFCAIRQQENKQKKMNAQPKWGAESEMTQKNDNKLNILNRWKILICV
jgi:hypothetical protein